MKIFIVRGDRGGVVCIFFDKEKAEDFGIKMFPSATQYFNVSEWHTNDEISPESKESNPTATNTADSEIHSDDPRDYCEGCGAMSSCNGYSKTLGSRQKLQP